MAKNIHEIRLTAVPEGVEQSFAILRSAGVRSLGDTAFSAFALFGGAPRDADYAAYHKKDHPVNDHDLRVLLPADNHDERIQNFVGHLGDVAGAEIREVPSAGTGRIRYCLDVNGVEMDVSVRPGVAHSISHVAISRAWDADIGLSSVAIAPDRSAWAAEEYENDRNNLMLSVYPDLAAPRRVTKYTERMGQKFPDHRVVFLQNK